MLITMLKGLRRSETAATAAPKPTARRSASVVVDLSGPLPPRQAPPAPVEHPYREGALVATSLRPTTYRADVTEMSRLPREIDPFEADFPWIGWVEPKHESIIRSDIRSASFDEHMQRVLNLFN